MLQTRLEVATVGILALWGTLSAVSRLLRRRQLGRWPVRYRIIQPGRLSRLNASEGRRSALLNHLRRFSDENGVPLEFIERPPGLEDVNLREYGRQDPVRYWLASRLALQLERDENLLLERVTDAFVCLERLQRITPDQFPYLIRLERLGSAEWNDDEFPWKVVVCCDEPLQLAEHFGDPAIQTWLGIGVDFISQKKPSARISRQAPPEASPPTAAVAQGRCRLGDDGLEGTVGGILEDGTQRLGITARHVLSLGCGSVAWPTGSMPAAAEFTQDSPDVAFIRPDSGCFPEAIDSAMLDVLPGCQADLEQAVWRDTKYRKAPLRDKLDGVVITAASSGFKLGKHFYRGQHFQMTPAFVNRMGIIFPLSKRFSKPGDSGAWVFEHATGKWIGMIVGGYQPPVTCCVAISAEFIFDMFSRYHATKNPGGRISGPAVICKAFL